MNDNFIEIFMKMKHLYSNKIEELKLANLGKAMKSRVTDFTHNFYGIYNIITLKKSEIR
jgi:hypothetical protein